MSERYKLEPNPSRLGKGISVPRFRRTLKWEPVLKILYGLMHVENIKISELAKIMNVNVRTVQAWVYQGTLPSDERRQILCDTFGVPENVLFWEIRDRLHTSFEPIKTPKAAPKAEKPSSILNCKICGTGGELVFDLAKGGFFHQECLDNADKSYLTERSE